MIDYSVRRTVGGSEWQWQVTSCRYVCLLYSSGYGGDGLFHYSDGQLATHGISPFVNQRQNNT